MWIWVYLSSFITVTVLYFWFIKKKKGKKCDLISLNRLKTKNVNTWCVNNDDFEWMQYYDTMNGFICSISWAWFLCDARILALSSASVISWCCWTEFPEAKDSVSQTEL